MLTTPLVCRIGLGEILTGGELSLVGYGIFLEVGVGYEIFLAMVIVPMRFCELYIQWLRQRLPHMLL